MNIHPIKTKADYVAGMHRINEIWDAAPKSTEADELEVLGLLIEEYEQKYIKMPQVDPVSLLLHVMEARALTCKEMEPFIDCHVRVAEVLNREQPLSLEMIRRLAPGLNLPGDLLIAGYELRQAA